jgi:enoyl-CoA hydratase/carnithine racemase
MSWDTVTVERQGPMAIVRMARNENLHAFNQELTVELTEAARAPSTTTTTPIPSS